MLTLAGALVDSPDGLEETTVQVAWTPIHGHLPEGALRAHSPPLRFERCVAAAASGGA